MKILLALLAFAAAADPPIQPDGVWSPVQSEGDTCYTALTYAGGGELEIAVQTEAGDALGATVSSTLFEQRRQMDEYEGVTVSVDHETEVREDGLWSASSEGKPVGIWNDLGSRTMPAWWLKARSLQVRKDGKLLIDAALPAFPAAEFTACTARKHAARG